MKKPDQVTFQCTVARKAGLREMAEALEMLRTVKGVQTGNISLLINWLITYVVEHEDDFIEWVAARLKSKIKSLKE